jgi:hypothetical protein
MRGLGLDVVFVGALLVFFVPSRPSQFTPDEEHLTCLQLSDLGSLSLPNFPVLQTLCG